MDKDTIIDDLNLIIEKILYSHIEDEYIPTKGLVKYYTLTSQDVREVLSLIDEIKECINEKQNLH